MNETGHFRKKNGFTIAGNTLVRDTRLSLKAKGLYLLIMSFITLETLDLTKSFLQAKCLEGEKAFQSAWDELKSHGYLKIYMKPGTGGHWQSEYDLLEEPTDGAHTFYLTADDQVAHTNLTKYAAKQCTTPVESEVSDRTPQKGRYADGGYGDGRYAKGGYNIRLYNNTLDNTSLNTPSIHPAAEPPFLHSEGLSDEELEELVSDELWDAMEIPYHYVVDERKMTMAVHLLTEYSIRTKGDPDTLEHEAFLLFNEALINMLTNQCPMKLKGAHITYAKVLEKLKRYIERGEGECNIYNLVETATSDFMVACKERTIKNHLHYMQSCIWNAMLVGNIGVHAQIERDFA